MGVIVDQETLGEALRELAIPDPFCSCAVCLARTMGRAMDKDILERSLLEIHRRSPGSCAVSA